MPIPLIKPVPTTVQLCRLIDEFLPEDDEAIRAFLAVLDRFVDLDRNDDAVAYEDIVNHAIAKTKAYRTFVARFLNLPGRQCEEIPESREVVGFFH